MVHGCRLSESPGLIRLSNCLVETDLLSGRQVTQSVKRQQNVFINNAIQDRRAATVAGIVIINTMST
jgi:hypothetical protein